MRKLLLSMSFVVMVFLLFGCGQTNIDDEYDNLGLAQVQDVNHLRSLVKVESSFSFFDMFRFGAMQVAEDADLDDSANEHSTTNVQVEGIDEGDIIKTDGNRIYYLRYNALTVIEIDENGGMTTIYDEPLNENLYGYYSELYITDDKLVVVGLFYEMGDIAPSRGTVDIDIGWFPIYQSMSSIDVYDKNTLEPLNRYEISGSLIGSRLIDDQLYLISNYYPEANADDPRPVFNIDGTEHYPEFSEIKYLPELPTRAFTIISNVDLSEESSFDYNIFLGVGYWGQLYVSETAIYLAANYTSTQTTRRVGDDDIAVSTWESHGKILSYVFNEDGSVSYGGSGDYKGHIINQFAMDEYEGTFRLVTRDGWGLGAINRLYIFERDFEDNKPYLKELALLDEGIGKPEETVRSVRFNKDIVTVVTFEEIDPFYVIDLSDPLNPTILGELEMPGFSTYQHPWKDDTIIGIGYETNDNGWVIGLKLSLYDISDYENPIELGRSLVLLNESQGWQYGEALHNHKAILISKTNDFIGFSIQRSSWINNHYQHHSDYLIFDIDIHRDTPIEIAASISHYDLFDANTNDYPWYYGYDVNRAITINDSLYVLSNGGITRHSIHEDFDLIDSIHFED